jgi:hypothetical protein
MNVPHGGWIRDDGISDEQVLGRVHVQRMESIAHTVSCFNTTSPGPFDHLGHLLSTLAYIPSFHRLHVWQQPRIFDHVRHQRFRVATNGEELDSITLLPLESAFLRDHQVLDCEHSRRSL